MNELEARALMTAQSEVAADRDRLEAFGATIPDVWQQVIFDGPNLVALLTDPEPYRERLLALVEHPDRLTVRAVPYSARELTRVRDEVLAIVGQQPGRFISAGPKLDHFALTLRSNEVELASTLQQQFGDVLQITLGSHPYPVSTEPPTFLPPTPQSTIDLPDIDARLEFDTPIHRPGDTITGTVHLRNVSQMNRVRIDTGSPAVGVTLHLDGHPAGTFNGAIAGVGRHLHLTPGKEGTIRFVAGSDAVNPIHGAALAPGHYLLVVPIKIDTDSGTGTYVTPPTPLVIA